MKLTANERIHLNTKAVLNLISDGTMTYREGMFYISLRDGAFINSKGNRPLSMVQIHHLVRDHNFSERHVKRTLSKLNKLGFIKAHYYFNVLEDDKRNLISVTNLKNFKGEGSIGTKNIKFVKYEILEVKGEKKLRKQFRTKKKQRNKHK